MFSLKLLLAISALACLMVHPIDALRILGLFPLQISSHFTSCKELMRGLAARGHQVDVYSHFPLKTPVPNYRDFSLRGTLPATSNNITYDVAVATDLFSLKDNWFESRQDIICELLGHPHFQKLLHDPPTDPPYDLVVTELSVVHCYIPFGRHLNVPVVGIVTFSVMDWHFSGFRTPINLAVEPSILVDYSAPMTFLQRVINVIIHKSASWGFMIYTQSQKEYIQKYFGPGLPSVVDLQVDVSLVLVNYDQSLFGVRTFTPKVVPVGGLHIVDHNETLPEVVQKWLDESTEGCIYFSFGSMVKVETFPKYILRAFYKSFENIAPIRVLLKISNLTELPAGLPSNVLTQSWFQQISVLKHKNVKAFVTHGGLMGTQEAIYFGVPMVGFPLFADQHFNIEHYVRKNVAIKIDVKKVTEKIFTKALKDILKNPEYKNSIEKLSSHFKDRPRSPMDTATFWIEYVQRHGKDILRSPAEYMYWWQTCLLDVYAFIILSISTVLYVGTTLLRKLLRYVQSNSYKGFNTKVKRK